MRTLEQLLDALNACHDDVCGSALIAEESQRTDAFFSMHDREGRYLKASQSITAFLGYDAQELIGRSAYDYIHPDDFEEVLRPHAQITIQAGMRPAIYRIRTKSGVYRSVTSLSKSIVNLQEGTQEILVLTFEGR